MEKEKLIYSVYEVFTTLLREQGASQFEIPAYQRGYKWTSEHVTTLLKDIDKFVINNNRFYCLQHISLCKKDDKLNVIDGQQRLTTLYIILSYLEKQDLIKGKLKYDVREETHKFLERTINNKNYWKEKQEKAQHKDQYYICTVADAIDQWFKNKNINEFSNKLLHHVKLIVNLPDGNEETIFTGLNGTRVQLDGADLVRAILITRASKERFAFVDDNRVYEFRIRMGMEIDEMNSWWSKSDVKQFFKQLLPERALKDNGFVKFDTNICPINLLYRCYFAIYSEDQRLFSFTFFEYRHETNGKLNDDHWKMYADITNLHTILQEWFENDDIYHALGYLFFQFKENVSLKTIWGLWNEDSQTTKNFIKAINRLSIQYLLNDYKEKENDTEEDTVSILYQQITNIQKDWFNQQDMLTHLLVLQDILYCQTVSPRQRLNVKMLHRSGYESEHIEHIWCQNPQEETLKDKKNITQWKNALEELKKEGSMTKELNNDIVNLNNILKHIHDIKEDNQEFINTFKTIAASHGAYSIGNLVLLNGSVNSGYSNALYENKRQIIIANYFGEDKKKMIRPWTLKVFVKGTSNSNDNAHWTLKDIKDNAQNIGISIKKLDQRK